jgi:hypothetical protein
MGLADTVRGGGAGGGGGVVVVVGDRGSLASLRGKRGWTGRTQTGLFCLVGVGL